MNPPVSISTGPSLTKGQNIAITHNAVQAKNKFRITPGASKPY
jgi:hypothetical protein